MPSRLASGAKTCSDSSATSGGHGLRACAWWRSVCSREARRSSTTRRSFEKASSILRTPSVCAARSARSPRWPAACGLRRSVSRAPCWIATSRRVCATSPACDAPKAVAMTSSGRLRKLAA